MGLDFKNDIKAIIYSMEDYNNKIILKNYVDIGDVYESYYNVNKGLQKISEELFSFLKR